MRLATPRDADSDGLTYIPLFVEFGAPATGGPKELVKMTFSES
jgi:hypothetical protein